MTSLIKNLFVVLLLISFNLVNAQELISVSGIVSDEFGPKPDVEVIATKSGETTMTNQEGFYQIQALPDDVLRFISIMGGEKEVNVNNQTLLDVTMGQQITLKEVVAIGYGTAEKKDLTGSVTSISSEDFNEGFISSAEQLIQGKTAGIQITTNGGAPGSGSSIRIRGAASLNASSDPLIVIDGMPIDNSTINGAANPLSLINPNDIESFNILKDASAAAIYGNRATNGVILITTKKGSKKGLKVGFNSTISISEKFGEIDVLNSSDYKNIVKDLDPNLIVGDSQTDWQEAIYNTAMSYDNNLSLSGGVGGIPIRLSLGYLNQDGILKTSNIERTTAGLNLNPKLFNNYLNINLNVKGSYAENRFADTGAIGNAVGFDPTRPIKNKNLPQFGGYWEWLQPNGELNTVADRNPVSLLEQNHDLSYVRRLIGNIQFDYKFHFLPALRANLNLGLDYTDSNGDVTKPKTLASVADEEGTYNEYCQIKKNRLFEFYLNYNKYYPSIDSKVDVLAGYSYQKYNNSVPFSPTISGNGNINPETGTDFYTQNILLSYYGRLNYAFKERYLLTASLRKDGSSRFSEENRWGYFPSLSLAWRLDQESFFDENESISTFKIRAGWGITGQQDIGSDYPFLAVYGFSNSDASYLFGDQYYSLLRPNGYVKNIRWETTETMNIGLDFGLMNDRILFAVDAYQRKTKDLLSIVPVPAGVNFTNLLLSNVGNLETSGLELSLTALVIDNENFTWDLTANATFQDSEITNLSATNNPDQLVRTGGIRGGTGNNIQVQSVGNIPNSFFVYEQKYDSDGSPLEGEYVDRNGDGIINEGDLYIKESPLPDALFGLSSRLNYYNWDFGFALRANFGNYVYNNMHSLFGNSQGIGNNNFYRNVTKDYLKTKFSTPQYLSDYYVEDASFLRMDNISLGYQFKEFLSVVNLKATFSIDNVFVISDYSGLDPEIFNGIDNNFYQRPRVYSLSLNFIF